MIIGFDSSRAFIPHRSGTENYSYQILKHLSLIDRKNRYIVYLRPNADIGKDKWPENFIFKTIGWPRLWTQVGLALTTFRDSLDLLFIPAHTLPLIKKPGLKTVVTVHDLGAEYLPKTHQLKQRLYLGLMTRKQLKSATRLIAVSESTKKDIVSRAQVSPSKISVVYEGFDEELFQPAKDSKMKEVLAKFGLCKNNYFLFVGTIQPRKNLERLIRAYAKVTQDPFPPLVLAGSKGWLSDKIYKLPKQLGIEDSVKFLGRVEDEELPALYSGAIALLLPSLFEGFGLPLVEAMACGCPVLTSNLSSMPEVVGDAAVLVDPYSELEIAEGIDRLYKDPSLRTKLYNKGFSQVKKFSWEKAARETLGVITSSLFQTGSELRLWGY